MHQEPEIFSKPKSSPPPVTMRDYLHGNAPRNVQAVQALVHERSGWVKLLEQQMGRVVVGQKALIDRLLVALLSNGHVLLEGVPGLAKTLTLKTLAASVHAQFKRIQFTPDMLPADVVGTLVYNARDGSFQTKHGPIFGNFILADEINRAPAKVQSALLEGMQERQVTLGGETYALPDPFMVLATQNPIEHEGTYALPEAQVDRFMLKVVIGYPNRIEERAIVDAMAQSQPKTDVSAIITTDEIIEARKVVDEIYMDDKVKDYVLDIVEATRDPRRFKLDLADYIQFGGSPRASIGLTLAAKAWAFLHGRGYVTPLDVKTMAPDVLRHRIFTTYEAEAEKITADSIVATITDTLAIP